MSPRRNSALPTRGLAFILLLCPFGCSCDCEGSSRPSGLPDVQVDADVGIGNIPDDTSADAGEDGSADVSEDMDARADVAPDGSDVDVAADSRERAVRTVITNTAGGGVVESSNTRAVIGIGAPQPAGAAGGENNSLSTGPGAVRP